MNGVEMLNKILDSNNTQVGGGASSAMVGAMAAGMISMVAKLSMKKEYGLSKDAYQSLASGMDDLAQQLLAGCQKDEEAYMALVSAYRMPKSNQEEQQMREQAILKAGIWASQMPKSNGFLCQKVYQGGMLLKGKSNPNALSDLLIALELAKVGVYGCVLNIEANLPLIQDQEMVADFKKAVKVLNAIEEKKDEEIVSGS